MSTRIFKVQGSIGPEDGRTYRRNVTEYVLVDEADMRAVFDAVTAKHPTIEIHHLNNVTIAMDVLDARVPGDTDREADA